MIEALAKHPYTNRYQDCGPICTFWAGTGDACLGIEWWREGVWQGSG